MVNVDKLVADAKAKQAEARKAAEVARKNAERKKADSKVIAESKSKMAYADTLKPRLKDYEERLKIWANKIARGDKLDTLEQKEFDKLVKDYKSLNDAIDKAIKDSYDIVVNYRREKADAATTGTQTEVDQQYGIYDSGVDENGNKITAVQMADKSVWVNQNPYTGKITFGDTVITYKNGKEVNRTSTAKTATDTSKQKANTVSKPGTSSKGKPAPAEGTDSTLTPSGNAIPSTFDPAMVRAGEEASMGAITPGAPTGTPTGKRTLESILGDVQNYFDLPDYIFKMDKDLGDLLVRAVNEKWTGKRWTDEFKLTNWYRKNSEEVRKRLTTFGNYEDLRSQGQDVSKSDYGLWLSKKKGQLKADARTIAGYALTDAEAEDIAKKIYLGFLDDDENAIRAFLVPFISKTTSIVNGMKITGYSGQALKDYQTLQAIAKANGFSLAQILPGISATTTDGDLEEAVLEKLALGELDINRISQDARNLAAVGQPQFVRGLLGQGYDLDQIYAPYKNTMANVLELNPEEISLNDPTLRSAISDKGETNLYDFQRALRKDSRWQYTKNARTEVSDITFNVLRDFGFQG